MTPAELIADRDAKKVVLDAAEEAWQGFDEDLYRRAEASGKHPGDEAFDKDRETRSDLHHAYNVAFLDHMTADGLLREKVFELRAEAEKLWFLREEALQSFKHSEGPASDFEQEIREAFDGVRLLIQDIGFDPQICMAYQS